MCGLPPEYCEFRADFDKCKEWIRENCPEVYPAEVLGVSSSSAKASGKSRGASGADDIEDKVSELSLAEDGGEESGRACPSVLS